MEKIKNEWFCNVRKDIISGIVVALALIPEAIAFAIIAGVDPMVGLYASFVIAVVISFCGGRPGMISAATGAMALVAMPLVQEYGLNYLLAATILTGVIQMLLGVFKIAKLLKFIPRSVMIGFVNALAILIFKAQIPHIFGISKWPYVFAAITLLIVYIWPVFIKSIPAPLVAIVALTAAAIYTGADVGTVGDLGQITRALPTLGIPDIPFNIETLKIILPFSVAMSIVGLLESLLTSTIVDDMTDTESDKNREARGQGIANIINGFFGGMAGCAMIGQSTINVQSGGRGRLSTFVAGVFLMFLIIVLGDLVVQIPMPVLAAIMVMVSISTFDFGTFSYMKNAPKTDTLVMLATVIIVVLTGDLSKGVVAGVILSALFFVSKISNIDVTREEADEITYTVSGQLFFASVEGFVSRFEYNVLNKKVIIDMTDANIWDGSGVGALDKVALKYRELGIDLEVCGLSGSSRKIVENLGVCDDIF